MKIAIIGSGLAGLSLAYHLTTFQRQYPSLSITVFDEVPIGSGLSKDILGLMHLYSGNKANLNWKGIESFQASLELLQLVSKEVGYPVFQQDGVFRIGSRKKHYEEFQLASNTYSDAHFWDESTTKEKTRGFISNFGLFIESGLMVNMRAYLSGLASYCLNKGIQFIQKRIDDLTQLSQFDKIIVASGKSTLSLITSLPCRLDWTKGQLLKYRLLSDIPFHDFPFVTKTNLVFSFCKRFAYIGASYERGNADPTPDQLVAQRHLSDNIATLYPSFVNQTPIGCFAGFRMSKPNRLPLATLIDDKLAVFTALGSKGLLYHAYIGRLLIEALLDNNLSQIEDKLTK